MSNDGTSKSSSWLTSPFPLIQLRALSIALARSSGVSPFFRGSSESSFLNTPLGSNKTSSSMLSLFRSHAKADSMSLDLSSAVRGAIPTEPTLANLSPDSSSLSMRPCWRIQCRAFSSSFARSSGVCPAFFGRVASNFLNTPSGSKVSSSIPIFRSQSNAASRSFSRSSDDLGATLFPPIFWKGFAYSSS